LNKRKEARIYRRIDRLNAALPRLIEKATKRAERSRRGIGFARLPLVFGLWRHRKDSLDPMIWDTEVATWLTRRLAEQSTYTKRIGTTTTPEVFGFEFLVNVVVALHP